MGFIETFQRSMMKNAYRPKISLSFQFWSEILQLLRSNDSIQILLILSRFQTFRTETKLEGFVWNHWSVKVAISHSKIEMRG